MTTSEHSLVFVGAVTMDTIALVEHLPGPDERLVADELVRAGGGPAATAAVTAARLGMGRVHFVGSVGGDEDGERALAELAAQGVDVSGVMRAPDRATGASVVLVDRARSTRAICTRRAPDLAVPSHSAAAELVRGADWVHVDHLGWSAAQALLPSPGADNRENSRDCDDGYRARRGPRLSVDAGNPIPGYRPRGVTLDVPTDASLIKRYGNGNLSLKSALRLAVEDGAECVVATRGARGSVARTADGRTAEAPGEPVEVVSTLGAGDVFHGALLTAFARDEPLRRCLDYANTVAALSCRALDGRSGIPAHDETAARIAHLSSTPSARS